MYGMNYAGNQLGGGSLGTLAGAMSAMSQSEAADRRMPEVVRELEQLQKQVESVAMTADALTNRLSPVRSPANSMLAKDGCGVAPDVALCTVADRIRSERRRLEIIAADLQRALNELEI